MNSSPRDEDGRYVDPVERRMMFIRGFRDGVKGASVEHPEDPDYKEAHEEGRRSLRAYIEKIDSEKDLPTPNVLRRNEALRDPLASLHYNLAMETGFNLDFTTVWDNALDALNTLKRSQPK